MRKSTNLNVLMKSCGHKREGKGCRDKHNRDLQVKEHKDKVKCRILREQHVSKLSRIYWVEKVFYSNFLMSTSHYKPGQYFPR